jgi:single-strand DNA-binding protein
MNNVSLVGRLTRDVEIRYTDGGTSISRFSIAVDRRFKSEGQPSADFINCVAFGKTAEFIEKFFKKGQRIGAIGRIQTGSYDNKDGVKVYTTDVIIEQAEFVESKGSSESSGNGFTPQNAKDDMGFMNIPDDVGDEGLPFN